MKNPLIKTSLAALMITGLAACSAVTPPNQSGMTTARNAAIGAAVGAAAGNLWGKDTEATLTGAAIGGLIGSEETKSLSKVPFLGDLPILGVFFRSVRTSKSDSEIMIFLTAHVLDETGGKEASGT